jgi:hypothetical protein
MLEERNANWELALKLLSHWVYEQKCPHDPPPQVLGELISGALVLAKQPPLIQDEHSRSPNL